MDIEKQKDEITALENIYNDEEFSYQEIEGMQTCTFQIYIRLPDDFHLSHKDTRIQEKEVTKVPISHLPPLTLYTTLPADYPSKSPPNFTLCSSWLRHTELEKLCRKLDEFWKENKEQEILFTWMAFLQNDTLEFLGIQEHLDISHAYTMYTMASEKVQKQKVATVEKDSAGKETKTRTVGKRNLTGGRRRMNRSKQIDQRAIVDRPLNQDPIQMLVDYNEMRKQIEFKKSFYMCKVCFTEKPGEHSTMFTPCRHVFCKNCIRGYLEVRITDGSVQNICCPEDKCTSEATPGQVLLFYFLFNNFS